MRTSSSPNGAPSWTSCASGIAFPNDFRRDALADQLLTRLRRSRDGVVRPAHGARQGRRPHDGQARHGQGELRQDRGSHRRDPAVRAERRARRCVRRVQDLGCRRHARRRRHAVQDQDRRAVGEGREAAAAGEVAAAAAGQVARAVRPGNALSPALCRSHRQPGQPAGVSHAHAHREVSARLPRCAGLPRSRNADDAGDRRAAPRRGRSSRITTRSTSICICASRRSCI